jgi:CheY-like chemotaxis protein
LLCECEFLFRGSVIEFFNMAANRILIVEDQREVSRLLHTSLDTLEYKLDVVEIFSGEEAILDASRKRVDLLISDYRLPGISGIELMRKVKQYQPNAKIILITGLTDPKVRKEVAEAGADSFFIKPVPIADFLDAVERHLGFVKTFLPPEPISRDEPEEEPRRSMPDLIVGLRQELGAQAVFLLNDQGRVLAQAGALPNAYAETNIMDSLMAMFSAGQKLGRIIGQKAPSTWHIFNGGAYDLVLTPIGTGHALLVAGAKLADEKAALETVNIISSARGLIEKNLESVGAAQPPKPEVEVPAQPELTLDDKVEADKDIEALLTGKKKVKVQDADAFWSEASEKQKAIPSKPDIITYEQARQLGLAPQEEKT